MLRVLMAVLLLQVTVKCDDLIFPEFKTDDEVLTGIVSNDQKILYSYVSKEIQCQALKEMKEVMDKISFLAELNIRQKKVESSEKSEKCTLVFVNVPKMKIDLKNKRYTLVYSFQLMLSQYQSSEYFKQFDITLDSFAYCPLLQRFVFIDIDKLTFTKQTVNDKATISQKMTTSFYNSLVRSKIPVSSSEIYIFKKFNLQISDSDKSPEDDKLEYFRYIPKESTIQNVLSLQYFQPDRRKKFSTLTSIKFTVNRSNDKLDVVFELNKISEHFTLENKDVLLIFFICKRDFKHESCVTIHQLQTNGVSITAYSLMEYRYEIEVQESSIVYLDNGVEKTKKIFEFYLMFIEKESSGFISNGIFLYSEPSQSIFQDVEIIICQDFLSNADVYRRVNDKFEHYNFIVGRKPIEIIGKLSMYQATQSFLVDGFERCRGPITKVFFIKKSKHQITLFFDEPITANIRKNQNKILDTIYSEDLNTGPSFSLLKKCNEPIANRSLLLSKDRKKLSHYSIKIDYPSNVILRYEAYQEKDSKQIKKEENLEIDCYDISYLPTIKIVYLNKNGRLDNFLWNFNLEDNEPGKESERTIVYVSKEKKTLFANISFMRYEYPNRELNNAFISFSKDNSSPLYKVRVVKKIEGNKILEIFFSDGVNSKGLAILPESFSFKHENASVFSSYDTVRFKSLNAVYFSHTEIVYQTKIDLQKSCNPLLVVEKKGKNIKINCKIIPSSSKTLISSSYESYKPSEGDTSVNLLASPGLYRVLKQTKPDDDNPVNHPANNSVQQQIRLIV